ncbi:MAG: DctP family TRAP transporter solute-binding subunit [Synergistaceae bacterium]|jgi:tripartite ATP-independent transporter DctP family solute receptor|nr:DctP family TRAP transporter solute-binding subunit [Synergistaceae bacterium]
MKKMILLLLVVFAFTAFTGTARQASAAEYTFRIAFIGPEAHGQYIALNETFKKQVEEKTKGRVAVEIYPNAQLGSDRQAIEGVSIGTIEMAAIGGSSLLPLDDRLKVMDLPFIFKTSEIAHRAYDEFLTEEFNKILEPHDILILYAAELGFRNITNNRGPIRKPADLAGLKIRTMENPLHVESFKLFGANPTPVAFSELYTALQQGTVDAQENPISVISTGKFYEVQKYLSLTGHIYTPTMLLVKKSYWESLPEDLRSEISVILKETQAIERKIIMDQNTQAVEELKTKGTEVNELTIEDKQAFLDLAKPVYDSYIEKYGDSFIKKINALD